MVSGLDSAVLGSAGSNTSWGTVLCFQAGHVILIVPLSNGFKAVL